MRFADRVVVVGEAVRRNTMEMFRLPAEKVITIPNAVDIRRIRTTRSRDDTRRALTIPPTAPVILSLGALTWEKDPLAHVEIGARVLERTPSAVHIMVGDGPMRGEVEAAIRARGLEGRVLMLGARTDAADFLAASDVLLFASRPDGMESMNASVIEAGMLGIPAAAYAVGGVPEIVIDGATGRLSRPGDVAGLAECVLELLKDREAAQAMGEAARRRYLSLYDMGTVAPMYRQLYEEVLGA
jgi:glycosyltransferase involved in cell wall biosynthesis